MNWAVQHYLQKAFFKDKWFHGLRSTKTLFEIFQNTAEMYNGINGIKMIKG